LERSALPVEFRGKIGTVLGAIIVRFSSCKKLGLEMEQKLTGKLEGDSVLVNGGALEADHLVGVESTEAEALEGLFEYPLRWFSRALRLMVGEIPLLLAEPGSMR
jgi:hypothetical protein